MQKNFILFLFFIMEGSIFVFMRGAFNFITFIALTTKIKTNPKLRLKLVSPPTYEKFKPRLLSMFFSLFFLPIRASLAVLSM
jgi:hypothetical protein